MSSDNENIKEDRKGFSVSSADQKDDAPKSVMEEILLEPKEHPAWPTFKENYFPAEEHERPEFLTTAELLEILNSIADSYRYSEKSLYNELKNAGFKMLTPAPAGMFVWMVKNTPNKMLDEAPEEKK
jgi:hypothetical protein